MKILVFTIVSLLGTISWADHVGVQKELLNDIKDDTKKCAIQTVAANNGEHKVTGFRSACATLKIVSSAQAQIFIEGQWYNAKIVESAESDGGDLDDLYISNANGQIVAKRTNVPAYDSVIVAMAGTSELRRR